MVAALKQKPQYSIPPSATEIYEVPLPDSQNPAFTPAKDGLPIFHGRTYQDHVEAWRHVNESIECRQWALGAIAASLVKSYGSAEVKRFAGDVGLSRSWIYEIADTYRKFEKSTRVENLSFKHHSIAAKADDPVAAIQKANDKHWSTRQLEHYVDTGFEPVEDTDKPVVILQSAERAILVKHIEEDALPALVDLRAKCPSQKFASKHYGTLYQDLKDAIEEIKRDDFTESLKLAWRNGKHTTEQMAASTGQPVRYVFSVLHDLEESDPPVFERVRQGGETEEARGKNETIWHLVGEPVGSSYSAFRAQSTYQRD